MRTHRGSRPEDRSWDCCHTKQPEISRLQHPSTSVLVLGESFPAVVTVADPPAATPLPVPAVVATTPGFVVMADPDFCNAPSMGKLMVKHCYISVNTCIKEHLAD